MLMNEISCVRTNKLLAAEALWSKDWKFEEFYMGIFDQQVVHFIVDTTLDLAFNYGIMKVGSLASRLLRTPRTWTSPDKYVGETANAIEARYPGKVVDVNKIVYRPDGTVLTDFDIELNNTIIQVKAGTAKGLTSQISKTAVGTTKEVIGYAPDLNPSSALVKNASKQGIMVFTSLEDLLNYLK